MITETDKKNADYLFEHLPLSTMKVIVGIFEAYQDGKIDIENISTNQSQPSFRLVIKDSSYKKVGHELDALKFLKDFDTPEHIVEIFSEQGG